MVSPQIKIGIIIFLCFFKGASIASQPPPAPFRTTAERTHLARARRYWHSARTWTAFGSESVFLCVGWSRGPQVFPFLEPFLSKVCTPSPVHAHIAFNGDIGPLRR